MVGLIRVINLWYHGVRDLACLCDDCHGVVVLRLREAASRSIAKFAVKLVDALGDQ